jgi:hypothetical protein
VRFIGLKVKTVVSKEKQVGGRNASQDVRVVAEG